MIQNSNMKILQSFSITLVTLRTKFIICSYYQFIKKFQVANLELQSEKPKVPTENDTLKQLYVDYLAMFMNSSYIKNTEMSNIIPGKSSEWKPLKRLSLCTTVIEEFMKLSKEDDKLNFLKDCRRVLVEICCKIKQRYNLDEIHSDKNLLIPKTHFAQIFTINFLL